MYKIRPETKGLLHLAPSWTPTPAHCLLLTLAPVWWQGELDQLTEPRDK